jgi:hypothetical protein
MVACYPMACTPCLCPHLLTDCRIGRELGHALGRAFREPGSLAQQLRWQLTLVRAGPAREGGASRRPRSHRAPSQPKRGHAPAARFACRQARTADPVALAPCERAPPAKAASAAAPAPIAHRVNRKGDTRLRRVSLGQASSHNSSGGNLPLCERAPPAKAASAAVPVSVRHRDTRKGDTRLAARFASQARSHKGSGGTRPVRAGPPRRRRQPPSPCPSDTETPERGTRAWPRVSRARLARTRDPVALAPCERAPREGGASRRPRSHRAPSQPKRGHALSRAFRLQASSHQAPLTSDL